MFSRITSTLTSSSSSCSRSSLARRITWATLPITSTSTPAITTAASSLLPSCLCSCSHVISSSRSTSSLPSSSFHSSSSSSSPSSSSSFSSSTSSSRRSFSTSTDSASSSLTSQPRLITLNTIADNRGARTKRTRVGRGPGSGLGKTAGRGHKGTWARGSLSKPGFEGGQTPSHRTMPKRGFTNIFKTPPNIVNLNRLQEWIDQGRIRTDEPITMKTLWDSRVVTKIKYGVKILARGGEGILKQPVHIECTDVSELAKKVIEEAGGSVKLVYFNRVGLRAHLKPEKFFRLPPGESSIPPPKKRDHFARQGVKAIRNQQTAADIAMANIRAQQEADAKKGITPTSTATPTVNEKEQKKKDKKEKKDKKAADATAAQA